MRHVVLRYVALSVACRHPYIPCFISNWPLSEMWGRRLSGPMCHILRSVPDCTVEELAVCSGRDWHGTAWEGPTEETDRQLCWRFDSDSLVILIIDTESQVVSDTPMALLPWV